MHEDLEHHMQIVGSQPLTKAYMREGRIIGMDKDKPAIHALADMMPITAARGDVPGPGFVAQATRIMDERFQASVKKNQEVRMDTGVDEEGSLPDPQTGDSCKKRMAAAVKNHPYNEHLENIKKKAKIIELSREAELQRQQKATAESKCELEAAMQKREAEQQKSRVDERNLEGDCPTHDDLDAASRKSSRAIAKVAWAAAAKSKKSVEVEGQEATEKELAEAQPSLAKVAKVERDPDYEEGDYPPAPDSEPPGGNEESGENHEPPGDNEKSEETTLAVDKKDNSQSCDVDQKAAADQERDSKKAELDAGKSDDAGDGSGKACPGDTGDDKSTGKRSGFHDDKSIMWQPSGFQKEGLRCRNFVQRYGPDYVDVIAELRPWAETVAVIAHLLQTRQTVINTHSTSEERAMMARLEPLFGFGEFDNANTVLPRRLTELIWDCLIEKWQATEEGQYCLNKCSQTSNGSAKIRSHFKTHCDYEYGGELWARWLVAFGGGIKAAVRYYHEYFEKVSAKSEARLCES